MVHVCITFDLQCIVGVDCNVDCESISFENEADTENKSLQGSHCPGSHTILQTSAPTINFERSESFVVKYENGCWLWYKWTK